MVSQATKSDKLFIMGVLGLTRTVAGMAAVSAPPAPTASDAALTE